VDETGQGLCPASDTQTLTVTVVPKSKGTTANAPLSGDDGDPVNTFSGELFFHEPLDLYLGGCAAFILFCLMILTFVDVVGREGLNMPLPGGFEITELLMAALIFTALPVVSWREEHVVIDLLDHLVPERLAPYRQALVNLVSATALAVLTWQTWKSAVELHSYNEITEYLQIPVWPIIYLISVMSGFATLAVIIVIFRYIGARMSTPSGGALG